MTRYTSSSETTRVLRQDCVSLTGARRHGRYIEHRYCNSNSNMDSGEE